MTQDPLAFPGPLFAASALKASRLAVGIVTTYAFHLVSTPGS